MSDVDREALQETLGPYAATITRAPRSTIRPAFDEGPEARARAAHVLMGLRQDTLKPLEIEGELGRGGMGVVRLATQTALGRKVAVKALLPERAHDGAALRLLQEAWITGVVEHPNIVPVHDLGLGDDGQPLVVLKRIEGRLWSDQLRDDDEVRRSFAVEDPFEWHLRTLMQVCTAIAFAHDRGIIHRDLKPENVMVGPYGEVYVMDWGIAVSLRPDDTGRLPVASKSGLVGTPAFMAPEMVSSDGAPLSEQTDVYLLGGLLYTLLTGGPPHTGDTPLQLALSAFADAPQLPDTVPPGLAVVCRRAMARDPGDRYPGAEALRGALQRFLDHRHSERLGERATTSLAALEDLASDAANPVERYRLFGEARFGFEQALESWPDNATAHEGLVRATRVMVEHELASENADAAAGLLGSLDAPPTDLVERVDDLRREVEARRTRIAELEALAANLDERTGRRTRIGLAVLVACLFGSPSIMRLLRGGAEPGYLELQGAAVLSLVVVALATHIGKTLNPRLRTGFNRGVLRTVMVVFAAQALLYTGAEVAGLAPRAALPMGQFMGALATAVLAACLVPRLWPAAVGYGTGYLVLSAHPGLGEPVAIVTNATLGFNAWYIWRQRRGSDAANDADDG